MDNLKTYASADEMVGACQPELPVIGIRPHAARAAASWFLDNFPGLVIYALKANGAPIVVSALQMAGICHFDVASMSEIKKAHELGCHHLHYMNPIKSRRSIGSAYFDYGVRSFAVDGEEELAKILNETNGAKDLRIFFAAGM